MLMCVWVESDRARYCIGTLFQSVDDIESNLLDFCGYI